MNNNSKMFAEFVHKIVENEHMNNYYCDVLVVDLSGCAVFKPSIYKDCNLFTVLGIDKAVTSNNKAVDVINNIFITKLLDKIFTSNTAVLLPTEIDTFLSSVANYLTDNCKISSFYDIINNTNNKLLLDYFIKVNSYVNSVLNIYTKDTSKISFETNFMSVLPKHFYVYDSTECFMHNLSVSVYSYIRFYRKKGL